MELATFQKILKVLDASVNHQKLPPKGAVEVLLWFQLLGEESHWCLASQNMLVENLCQRRIGSGDHDSGGCIRGWVSEERGIHESLFCCLESKDQGRCSVVTASPLEPLRRLVSGNSNWAQCGINRL